MTIDDGYVTSIVEKPDGLPSTVAVTGSYVAPPSIFYALELIHPSKRCEYEFPDAIGTLIRAGATVAAVELDCPRVNVNTPEDIEQAEDLLGSDQD